MTDFKEIRFTGADVIKLIGFLFVTVSMWIDLKTDQIKVKSKNEIIEYKIAEIQNRLGILPKEIKFEEDGHQ